MRLDVWELRGFMGTWEAFKYAVLYDVSTGLLPTMVKLTGKEAVKETVANIKLRVQGTGLGRLMGLAPKPSP